MVIKVENEEHLEQLLTNAGTKLVVIDFYASWCGPCKIISPKVDEMSEQMGDEVVFLKVDVDACEKIAENYEIISMPTFHFVKGKKKLENFSGANIDKLKQMVAKWK